MIEDVQENNSPVLVVDDDQSSLDLARLTLGRLGFSNVQQALDGNEALRVFDAMQRKPNFLICDIYMPDHDGFEFVDALAQRGYQGGIILVSSGDPQMLYLAKQVATGSGLQLLGAFAKPLRQEHIQAAIAAFVPCDGEST